MKKTFKVEGMSCSNCAKAIQNSFEDKDGITCNINVSANKATIKYDESKYNVLDLAKIVDEAGYKLVIDSSLEDNKKIKRKMKKEVIISLILSLPLLWAMFSHLKYFKWLYVPQLLTNGVFQFVMASIVQFYIGKRFYISAYKGLRKKVLGMDALVVLGTTSAYLYSVYILINERVSSNMMHPEYFFEISALIITMVLIGNYIEHVAKEKTTDALVDLVNLAAKEARIMRECKEVFVPIDEVVKGDEIIVLANEKIPVDGIIIKGETSVDEASFTGESLPVKKVNGQDVIGATINLSNKITVKATKVGSETMLSKIIQTVEEASVNKSPIQRVADKVASYFVPLVVSIALLNFIVQYFGLNIEFIIAFKRSVAILVISCPCALGLATPTSVLVGNGLAAKNHILYKGGEFFEVANKIKVICFDKTGTLTIGKPVVTDFEGDESIYDIIYSVEKESTHPISLALKKYLEDKDKVSEHHELDSFEVIKGKGLKAELLGKEVYIGSIKIIEDQKIELGNYEEMYNTLLNQAKTVNFVVVEKEIKAMYAIRDEIKPTSKLVINEMKQRGLIPVMITGDNRVVAKQIANELGISKVYYEVMPKEKSDIVRELQKNGDIVAFVGDGVNDAPALELADVGIAMGHGTDIAINSSDVTLLSNDLSLVIKAIDISKATLKNIYQNFMWAFSYNIVAIPLAALGYLSMVLSAAAMAFSSIMVVLNALRLRNYKLKDYKIKGDENMKLTVESMSCMHCVNRITSILKENGANKVECDLKTKEVEFNGDITIERASELLSEAGYPAK